MEVILLGVSYLDFNNPDTGELIQGYQLQFAIPQQNTNGFAVQKKFIGMNHNLVQHIQMLHRDKNQKFPVKAVLTYGPKDSIIGIDIK